MTRASNVEIFSSNFRATIGIVSPTLLIELVVPKVDIVESNLFISFGAGLFEMVPKEQYVDLTEPIRFNTSLFDTVPKEGHVVKRSKFFHSLLSYQKRPASR